MAKPGLHEPKPPFRENWIDPPGKESELDPAPRYEAPLYHPAGKLRGKVAIVTGGDSGIGRAVATLFAREGADVAVLCLPEEKEDAETTLASIDETGQSGMVVAGDVGDPDFCAFAVRQVVDRFERIDILVNNAAMQESVADVEDLDVAQWRRTFRTNIDGYFFMTKATLPHLPMGGTIINSGSVTGVRGHKGLLDYSATKGAIHAFTKTLAQMLVDRGIRVNCVAPGPVWTPLNPADPGTDVDDFGANKPYGRPAQPEEIAPTYVFLASNGDSSYISGEVIRETGAETHAG